MLNFLNICKRKMWLASKILGFLYLLTNVVFSIKMLLFANKKICFLKTYICKQNILDLTVANKKQVYCIINTFVFANKTSLFCSQNFQIFMFANKNFVFANKKCYLFILRIKLSYLQTKLLIGAGVLSKSATSEKWWCSSNCTQLKRTCWNFELRWGAIELGWDRDLTL